MEEQMGGVKGLGSSPFEASKAARRPQAAAGDKTHRSSSYLAAEIMSRLYTQQVFPESDPTEAGSIGRNGINVKNRDGS